MTTHNYLQNQANDQKMLEGLQKHSSAIGSLLIGGQAFKPADIIALLQPRIVAAKNAQSARAIWQTAVKASKDERTKTHDLDQGLRQALAVAFAGSADTLADFGLTPRKRRPTSPEKKAAAVLKAKATRAARHTAGKKQKQAIKGVTPTAAAVDGGAHAPAVNVPSTGGAPATATPLVLPKLPS